MIATSTYYCNWMKEYRRVNYPHFILALGQKNDKAILSDPMTSMDLHYVDIDEVLKIINSIFVVDHSAPLSMDEKNKIKCSSQTRFLMIL